MPDIFIDLETISTVNVTLHGLYRHCEDDTLDITMCCWGVDQRPIRTWTSIPEEGTVSSAPLELVPHFTDPEALFWAHNAAYERWLTKAVWGVDIPLERWRCTSVIARWYNMPASLDGFSRYMLGKRYAKHDSTSFKYLWSTASLPWSEEDIRIFTEEMLPYCARDVEAMRDSVLQLPPLPEKVWKEYAASERINDRGVSIDADFALAATELRAVTDEETKADIRQLTGGSVTTPRGPKARIWMEEALFDFGYDDLLDEEGQLTRNFKKRRKDRVGFYTETRPTFDKSMRNLLRDELDERSAPQHLFDFLDLIDEGNNAAVTKFAATTARLSSDGRLRGMYIFAGAAQTHRFSSTGVQTHNLLRDTLDLDADLTLRQGLTASGRSLEARLAEMRQMPAVIDNGLGRTLSMALRGTLKAADPETQDLYWADWSAIEARALPWLAGDTRKLNMFRKGVDVYISNAAALYGIRESEVDKTQRQVGKVEELALGYGGGKGAFNAMARGYGVSLSPDWVKQAVITWRENNPVIVDYWKRLEKAAFAAMRNACEPQHVGQGVAYLFAPNVAYGALLVALPCGSMLVYPHARIEEVERFEDQPPEDAICFDHPAYGRSSLWHGTLVENITQAVCASLLRNLLVRAEACGHQIVAHTHDEAVGECPTDAAEDKLRHLIGLMETTPGWAEGLPLAAEGGIGSRYKVDDAAY